MIHGPIERPGRWALALLALLLLTVGGAIAFVYTGFYNVAATEQHTRPVFWLIEKAMLRSVERRASAGEVPQLDSPQRLQRGFALYRRHCEQCHGGPGVAPQPFALGMTPLPNNLVQNARDWTPGEIHWVVEQGVKMTGMPAWKYRMSDTELWDVTAFVKALARLSPIEYAALAARFPPAPSDRDISPDLAGELPDQTAASADDTALALETIRQYGCPACHRIPGVVGSDLLVGPPLAGIGSRSFIAGVLANTPENMVRWLQDPQAIDPLTAMPDLGVTEPHARRIAAYLATLDHLEAE